MHSDPGKIDRIIDEHREYLESIGNSVAEGAWEGLREGVSKGGKKGAREGLKRCLGAGFPNVDVDTIEDIAASISGLAISKNITKGTSEAIETSLKGYLDKLSDELLNGIRRQELPMMSI